MATKLYKTLLVLGIILVLISVPAFWLTFQAGADLEVNFLDVGQGDSILIKTPMGQNLLIDGGPGNAVIKELSKNLAFWDKTVDLMILTHPHDDHVTGLIEVIKRYKVNKILYTGAVHSAPNYLTWLELIRDKKIPLVIIDRPQVINLGEECYLDILYPQESFLGKEVNNLNNSSIVARLVYGQTKFLFMGDAEFEVEEILVETQNNKSEQINNTVETQDFVSLRVDILKVGHHGSDTSSSEEFLKYVKPAMAVIQVGKDNYFNHPGLRVIKRLERSGAEIFRNDEMGTVKLKSDGRKIIY
ncbi:MAG: MBL fold metallo-hydrolase [Patescibacteria group bacterium]